MPYRFTSRRDGDLRLGSPGVDQRRRAVIDLPWFTVRQVHGRDVVITDGGDPPATAPDADALVTATAGIALSVKIADCAPVALLAERVVGAAHAGWRGIEAGVLPAAVVAMRSLGATEIRAVLGPCIHAECYEFGTEDLDRLATALGDVVRGETSWGAPALDVPAAVRASLASAGVDAVDDLGVCTACSPDHWSHRAAGDPERQAVVVWI